MRFMDKLTGPEIRILRSIYTGKTTLKELAEEHRVNHTRVSKLASSLEQKGFLVKQRTGNTIKLSLSGNPFVEYFKQMLSTELQLENILGDSGLPVLLTLIMPEMSQPAREQGKTALNIHQIRLFSGLPKATIYRFLSRGMYAGAIRKDRARYSISESMTALKEFLRQYSLHTATARMKKIAEFAGMDDRHLTLHFVSGNEFIFSSPAASAHAPDFEHDFPVFPTGLTAFMADGLEFRTNRNYYHFAPNRGPLRIEDHAVDILLIDRKSSRDIQYSLLYLKKNMKKIQRDYLYNIAEIFGLSVELHTMLAFLDGEMTGRDKAALRDTTFIPKTKEFEELCDMYGVSENEEE